VQKCLEILGSGIEKRVERNEAIDWLQHGLRAANDKSRSHVRLSSRYRPSEPDLAGKVALFAAARLHLSVGDVIGQGRAGEISYILGRSHTLSFLNLSTHFVTASTSKGDVDTNAGDSSVSTNTARAT